VRGFFRPGKLLFTEKNEKRNSPRAFRREGTLRLRERRLHEYLIQGKIKGRAVNPDQMGKPKMARILFRCSWIPGESATFKASATDLEPLEGMGKRGRQHGGEFVSPAGARKRAEGVRHETLWRGIRKDVVVIRDAAKKKPGEKEFYATRIPKGAIRGCQSRERQSFSGMGSGPSSFITTTFFSLHTGFRGRILPVPKPAGTAGWGTAHANKDWTHLTNETRHYSSRQNGDPWYAALGTWAFHCIPAGAGDPDFCQGNRLILLFGRENGT